MGHISIIVGIVMNHRLKQIFLQITLNFFLLRILTRLHLFLEHQLHCMIVYGILIVVPPIILQMIAIISPLKLLTLAANLLS